MSRVEDIMQMCRLCLDKDQVNTPIFDEPTDLNQTFLKISSCLPVKVSPEDNLPKKICDDCAYKLDMAYQFRNTSTNSEKQLIQLLDQIGIPPHQAPGKSEISVKLEHVAADDGDVSPGAQNYILQQQKLPYPQEFSEFGEEAPISESPPKKRAKRAAASKKPATVTKPPVEEIEEVETDPLIDASVVTKAEDDSDDSDNMALSSFATASATSSADQPGPSGIGKGATLNAPLPVRIFIAPQQCLQVLYDDESKPLEQTSYICFVCDKVFPSEEKLKHHSRAHREKLHCCQLCPSKFHQPSMLRKHVELVHDTTTRGYVCETCEKSFKNKAGLRQHNLIHTKNYKHKCDLCGKGLSGPLAVQKHKEEVHEGRQYKCETCGKLFNYFNNYLQHSKQHDPNYVPKVYTCEHCQQTFLVRVTYKRHLRKHMEGEDMKSICDICGKRFNCNTYLKKHKAIHTGEKNFVCETCGKAFAVKEILKDHIRVHTKEKPHRCGICNKGFAQRGSLTIHIRSHTGERPFKCSRCSKGFVTGSLLKTHKCSPI